MDKRAKQDLLKWQTSNKKLVLGVIKKFNEDEMVKEYVLKQKNDTTTYIMQSNQGLPDFKFHTFVVIKPPSVIGKSKKSK